MYFADLDYLMGTNHDSEDHTSSMLLKICQIPHIHNNILCGVIIVTLRKEAGAYPKRPVPPVMNKILSLKTDIIYILVYLV